MACSLASMALGSIRTALDQSDTAAARISHAAPAAAVTNLELSAWGEASTSTLCLTDAAHVQLAGVVARVAAHATGLRLATSAAPVAWFAELDCHLTRSAEIFIAIGNACTGHHPRDDLDQRGGCDPRDRPAAADSHAHALYATRCLRRERCDVLSHRHLCQSVLDTTNDGGPLSHLLSPCDPCYASPPRTTNSPGGSTCSIDAIC